MSVVAPPKDFVPFEPLWRIARVESGVPEGSDLDPSNRELFGVRWLSDLTGVNRDQLYRYKRWNRVPLHTADRIAVALGYHPVEIWGDLWTDDTSRLFHRIAGEVA